MNKIILILLGAFVLGACSKEDRLEPTGAREDYFSLSPADTVNNPEAALRYRFYHKNKVHLLFNDTLRHEQRGTYADGSPYWFTEVIDMTYTMEDREGSAYRYGLMSDTEEQKAGIEFLEKYILPHFEGSMSPYSVFLVKKLEAKSGSKWKEKSYYAGLRCMVINTGLAVSQDEEDIETFCWEIFKGIISSKIDKMKTTALDPFYIFSSRYYGVDYEDFNLPSRPKVEELYEYGFIKKSSWNFPYKDSDMEAFINAIFDEDEEEFRKKHQENTIILQKYDTLKGIIEDMGFKF